MNYQEFIKRLKDLGLPVVSLEEISNIIQKPIGYTRLYVNRLYSCKKLSRIEAGLYCLPETDEYTIASRIIPYSYITAYGALYHYGLTTQIPVELRVVSSRYHRPVRLKNFTVKFSKVRRDFVFGYSTARNGPSFAEPEKIFIDDLYLHRRQYYSEEFYHAVKAGRISPKKIKEYAIRSNDRAVASMMGHYLEKSGVDAKELLPFRSKAYLKLNKYGAWDRLWRVYA